MAGRERIAHIDVMKGIAILCVVAGHYLGGVPFLPTIIWSFHMPLFIFLNGYFFREGPVGQRIKKSAKAYLKPYMIVWGLFFLADLAFALSNGNDAGNAALVSLRSGLWAMASETQKPCFVNNMPVVWFLAALFVGNVLLALVLKIRGRGWQFAVVSLLLAAAALQFRRFFLPLGLDFGVAFLFWLWIGFVFAKLMTGRGSSLAGFIDGRGGFAVCAIIWCLVLLVEGKTGRMYNICWLSFPLYGLELLGALAGILTVWHISRFIDGRIRWLSAPLQFLGRASLWMLCVHALEIKLFSGLLFDFSERLYGAAPSVVCGLVRLVLDVALALLLRQLYKCIRKKVISDNYGSSC